MARMGMAPTAVPLGLGVHLRPDKCMSQMYFVGQHEENTVKNLAFVMGLLILVVGAVGINLARRISSGRFTGDIEPQAFF